MSAERLRRLGNDFTWLDPDAIVAVSAHGTGILVLLESGKSVTVRALDHDATPDDVAWFVAELQADVEDLPGEGEAEEPPGWPPPSDPT